MSGMTTALKLPIGHEALEQAIASKTLSGLAKAIDADYQLIQGWRVKTRKFATPAEYCRAVERATGVPVAELRPDLFA